ncbi:hypothetical protein D4764_08G0000500 [Takifugu flavidus]|uniref:Uncharacterized protein n=1 Tax=Takifugu flavidus TaxID=433684 RepID=A0A5C6MMG5_9TELE|nr:hypothetical protein D4764_08G0000500 [Takifugu flavidus]
MGCNMCVVKRPEEQYRIMFQTGDGCSAEIIIRESQSDFLKLQVRTLGKAAALVGLEDCAYFQVLTWHLAVLIRHHGNSLSGIHEAGKI